MIFKESRSHRSIAKLSEHVSHTSDLFLALIAERWRSELVSAEPQQPHSTKISSRDVLLVSRCEFSAVCCQPNHRNIITQRDGAGLFEGFWSEIALETGSKSKHIKVMAPTEQKINEKKACHPYSINPAPRWCIKSV